MTSPQTDTARLTLALTELRLPAIKALWPRFAEQADKEGWPAARMLSTLSYSRKLVMALMGGISWRCSRAAILSREKDMPHDEVYHHAVARSIGIFV